MYLCPTSQRGADLVVSLELWVMSFLNSELITLNSELEEAEIIPNEPGRVMLPREYRLETPVILRHAMFQGFLIRTIN